MKQLFSALLGLLLLASVAGAQDDTTPNIELTLPTIGSGTWGEKVNENFELIDTLFPGGGAINLVQDEGTPLPLQPNVNFTGAGVTCSNDAGDDRINCDIPGGGGGAVLDGSFTIQNTTDDTKELVFDLSGITTGQTRIITVPDSSLTLVGTTTAQTLSNKTLGNTTVLTIKDGSLTLQESSDVTKQAVFELSGITAGNTRTVTIADGASATVIGSAAVSTQFMTGISAAGVISRAQPALTDLSAGTSANLASVISNETGSGSLVFATSPTLVTPVLGAASASSLAFTGSSSGTILIQPAAAAGTYTLTLPTDDGTASQFLQTDGSGTLVWATPVGAGDVSAASTFGTDNVLIRSDGTSKGVQSTGITIADTSFNLVSPGSITSGTAGTATGAFIARGTTSGAVSILPQAAAGTYNFNLPTTAGSSGQVLTSAGGGASAMTWTSAGTGDALVANPLSQFAATTSAQLRGVLSDESGTGAALFAGGALGAATATSINGLTITTTSGGTLTLANSSTLATSGTNSITLTSTGATNVTLPTTGTLATVAATQPVDATLTALAAYSTTGFVVQTASDTFAGRTFQDQTGILTWTNPAGTAGNPSLALATAVRDLSGRGCSDAGGDDAYSCNMGVADSAYVTNAVYTLKPATQNTTAASVDYSSLGVKNIKKFVSGSKVDPATGDICANHPSMFIYDGTDMVLISTLCNPASGSISATTGMILKAGSSTTGVDSVIEEDADSVNFGLPIEACGGAACLFEMDIGVFATTMKTWDFPANASSTFVGDDTTQTLTNKTMSGSSNTFSNIPGTATTTGAAFFVYEAGSNVTCTAPGDTTFLMPGVAAAQTAETWAQPVPRAGTVNAMKIITSAVPSGETLALTVRKNGVDTSVTCSIAAAGTSCTDTAHSVAYAQFDTFSIKAICSGGTDAVGEVRGSVSFQ